MNFRSIEILRFSVDLQCNENRIFEWYSRLACLYIELFVLYSCVFWDLVFDVYPIFPLL
jgi:hypothetical protein